MLRTELCLREEACLIPGLAKWIKDRALPQAAAQFADAAWIQCCHARGHSYIFDLTPAPGTFICHKWGHEKKKEKKIFWTHGFGGF